MLTSIPKAELKKMKTVILMAVDLPEMLREAEVLNGQVVERTDAELLSLPYWMFMEVCA